MDEPASFGDEDEPLPPETAGEPPKASKEVGVSGGLGMDIQGAVVDALGHEGAAYFEGGEAAEPHGLEGLPQDELTELAPMPAVPPRAMPIDLSGQRPPPHESLLTLGQFFQRKGAEIEFADEPDSPFDGEAVFPSDHIFVFRYIEKPTMRDAIDFHNSLLASRAIFGFLVTGEPEPDLRVFSVGKDLVVLSESQVTEDGKYVMEAID